MDDTNEDSWLYGTSNPDSTTNEIQGDVISGTGESTEDNEQQFANNLLKTEAENEAQALAAVQNACSDFMASPKIEEDDPDVTADDFEDPAHEMEEDEDAVPGAASTIADTIDDDDDNIPTENGQQQAKISAGSDEDDEDDSDDDINVVIGDIKAAPSTYNIKQRSNLLAGGQSGQEKSKGAAQGGKFSIEDFEGAGTINGVATHEFSIDSLEDKPWRKPGADITDYFNYGFNEETWRAYCERQKRFRVIESGIGLASLTQNLNQSMDRHGDHPPTGLLPPPGNVAPPGTVMSDHSQAPPPGTMPPPTGHHHGGIQRIPLGPRPPRPINSTVTIFGSKKENAIQVMTAECREYSRPGQMATNFGGPQPGEEIFFPETDPYDYGYEPTQESQWGNNDNPGWVPSGIKELTPGPALVQAPPMGGPPGVPPSGQMGVPPTAQMGGPPQMRGPPPPQMMPGMPPNMAMGPPPPHVMGPMIMGPGTMRMPPMGGRMMPPQQHGGPQMPPNSKEQVEERQRSPNRRNRSRSPHRSRRRSKSPVRQRRSRSLSKSRKTRPRRSRSSSKSRKTTARSSRRSRSRSGSKSRKTTSRTHRSRSPSESKSRTKRSRRTHSRSRSKSPKTSSSSSSKKRSEKTEK